MRVYGRIRTIVRGMIVVSFCSVGFVPADATAPSRTLVPGSAAAAQAPGAAPNARATTPGTPFSAERLASLLPATVYFEGRTAPIQLRNAAGTSFGENAIVWVALVDSSGYSSGVQEKYQFYLVTESGLQIGDVHLTAGAYGGGFVGDRFELMDLGGHTVGEGTTQLDAALRRPRPLLMEADQPASVKLYLGRRWVMLRADPHANAGPAHAAVVRDNLAPKPVR